jgi:GNAT superfamily N-acetyltransferase
MPIPTAAGEVTAVAEAPVEIDYRYVECGQLGALETTHPMVSRMGSSDEHYPSNVVALRACPDAYPGFPCYFYLHRGDRIVASLAALPDVLTADGRSIPWAWTASFFTSPDCRGLGLGAKLWAAATRTLHERGITVGGAFANPVTTHICERMGFTIMDRVPRLLLLKSARPFLSQHVRTKLVVSLLNGSYKAVAGGIRALTRTLDRDSRTERLSLVNSNDVAMLERAAAPSYDRGMHFNDSWNKFAWKVAHCRNSDVHLIRRRSSQDVLARFVVKTRRVTGTFAEKYTGFRLMTLMDYALFGEPGKGYDALADAVVKQFWDSDAEVLETVSASPDLNARLRRKFMIPGGQGVAFWFKAAPGVTMPPDAAVITNWHFTHFCTDAFSFG